MSNAWRDLPPLRPSAPPIELTAPVQRLADTMTSKHHTGVTGDELGHVRTVDGPAGTVVGLLKPRVALHRERTEAGPLIYAAAAPEPIAAASAVPLRGTQRQAIAPAQRLVPPPVDSSAPVDLIPPHRSPAPSAGLLPPVGSPPLAPPVPGAGAHQMPTTPTELPTVAARPVPAREYATPAVPTEALPPLPVAVAGAQAASVSASRALVPPSPPTGSDAPRHTQRAPLVGTTRIVRRIGEPLRERPASMVSTADSPAAGVTPPPLAIPAGIARLPDDVPAAPPRPGVVPARVARPVASIDVASSDPGTQRDTPAAAGPLPTRPLVGSRPSIQRLAESPAAPTARRVESAGDGPVTDHDAVPVRWGPIAERRVQRAPEGVPADLRSELEPVLGTPLDDVKVHRDPDTGAAARHLSAKAFTAGGEVFLPDWHGSTSTGEARTILAHELTHVAQQRRLGASLPDEASPTGAELESEARSVAGQGPPVPTRPVAPSPSAPVAQRLPGAPPSRSLRASPEHRPASSPERASSGLSPMDVVARVQAAASAAGIATPPAAESAGHPTPAPTPDPVTAPVSERTSGTAPPSIVQRLPGDSDGGQPTTTSTSSNADAANPTTPEDPGQLDELARRLYPRFRTRLRQDLLADRERSGRLFDVR